MSRFKSFGRKEAKKDIADPSTSAPIDAIPSSAPAAGADDDLPLPERAQRQLINAALSRPIQASPTSEAPQIRFAGDLVMMIGEEAQDAGAWATVYRGPISRCASNTKELEAVLPQWLLDFSLHNIIQVREPIKIAFVLEPWGGPEKAGLPELPSG
jgi:WD repeat-containing protein 48